MLRKFYQPLFLLLTVLMVSASVQADEVPAWLRQAASLNPTVTDKDARSIVLHDETRVTVEESGRVTRVTTYAVRILTRDGRDGAMATAIYNTESEKIKDLKAWLIRPSGQVIKYGKNETMDSILDSSDVYDEARRRSISARDDAEPGAVFGYEVNEERKSVFSQFRWWFQSDQPVVSSRFIMTVPPGWRAEGVVFNHPKIEPVVSGTTWTWEARNLEGIKDEPASPSGVNLAACIAVSVYGAAGTSAGMMRTFSSWSDVSVFLSELSDPQVQLDDALALKARELTASAKTEFEKIQAIGRYAQNIKYVSIQIGTGRGGGMRPHTSLEVFNKGYGDCKDKANLMRAMLRALNITAYPVVIFSGDPTFVREEYPSPNQFNHCIIAVKVSDAVQSPTIIAHPKLGRLLIFDPTDDDTSVGDLPDHEQNSLALVVAGTDGALLRMPVIAPEHNRLERTADVTLSVEGTINAVVRERSVGQSAVNERRLFRRLPRPDYVKLIERWIARNATGAKVGKIEPKDEHVEGRFALEVEFTAIDYARSMRGQLLVFKPAIVSQRQLIDLREPKRKYPVVLESEAWSETVRVKLPDGFAVDEMPDPLKLEAPFGKFAAKWEVKDGHLVFTRSCEIKATTIPAEQYTVVRNFYGLIGGSEQSPVVLAKK